MTNSIIKIQIGRRAPLVKNPLLLEGISRAGKFLLGNIVNGFQDVEPVQYRPLVEHILYLENCGLIATRVAEEIIKSEIDIDFYEMLIGRHFNLRPGDKSSIYNISNYKKYLQRGGEPDGEQAVKSIKNKILYSTFIVHETLPNIKTFFNIYPQTKVVSLSRSPLDLVYSWHKRGWGKRYGKDPLAFNVVIKGAKGPIPWFAKDWQDKYYQLSEIDRIIKSIDTLTTLNEQGYKKLSQKNKRNILFLPYELILSNPKSVIKKLRNFLKKNPLPEMEKIIKREKLPNLGYLEAKKDKTEALKKIASKKYFDRLIMLEEEYNKKRKAAQLTARASR